MTTPRQHNGADKRGKAGCRPNRDIISVQVPRASKVDANSLSDRTKTIMTYALCGFANFSSIGIQLGGIGALAPERRADLAKLGLRAMIGGTLASLLTASIAALMV